MLKWLRNLFCKHKEVTFIRNIGGDEMRIHYVKGFGLAKSAWLCKCCGSTVYKGYRYKDY